VSTEHSCVPRDIIAIGHNRFLFGYNIQFGLKATTSIEDVFNVYDYDQESHTFSPVPVEEVLSDSAERAALNERFEISQSVYRKDPWAEHTSEPEAEKFQPIADLTMEPAE
jgi:hypothetical protein